MGAVWRAGRQQWEDPETDGAQGQAGQEPRVPCLGGAGSEGFGEAGEPAALDPRHRQEARGGHVVGALRGSRSGTDEPGRKMGRRSGNSEVGRRSLAQRRGGMRQELAGVTEGIGGFWRMPRAAPRLMVAGLRSPVPGSGSRGRQAETGWEG